MVNDSLFLDTKRKIESWRKIKKHIREPIPKDIKSDLSKLAQVYPVRKIGSAFKLSDCSLRFLNRQVKPIPKPAKHQTQFVELSPVIQNKMVTEQKRIELDLPDGLTLRIFL